MKQISSQKDKTLNFEIFKYLIILSAALLALLWFFQTVLLQSTYKAIRVQTVRRAVKEITKVVNGSSFYDLSEYSDYKLDPNLSVIIFNGNTGERIEGHEQNIYDLFGRNPVIKFYELMSIVGDADDKLIYVIKNIDDHGFITGIDTVFSETDSDDVNSLVYVKNTVDEDDTPIMIMMIGEIVPVGATIQTLRVQLAIISVLLIIISFIVSIFAARRIARPIEVLNEDTKIMATGNYDIKFNGTGYTEIRQLSDTLNNTVVQLKQADQITKDLIANVSHDLRTPLTMISGYGELMRDVPGENTPENVQVIIDEANRLTYLVNNLLDISQLQAGNVSLSLSRINAREFVEKITVSYQKMLENENYHFISELDQDDCFVEADSMRLEQVFHNLINNAISHIGADRTVIVSCHKGNGKVRFDVIDHGEGIAESDIKNIWERYYRVDKQHVRQDSGSGLGLSIVKTILELHNAAYGVNSKLAEGSDFWFELPIAREDK